ncbi:hypothetical protein J7L48_00110 [bacterium]|nr:hypothetical protein [bacterium]
MAIINVEDIIKILYDIKMFDDTLSHLIEKKAEILENVVTYEEKIVEIDEEIKEKNEKKKELHKKQRDIEEKISSIESKIKGLDEGRFSVKTNEDFFKIGEDINKLKKGKGELEDKLLDMMYNESDYETTFKTLKEKLDKNKKEMEEELKLKKNEKDEVEANIKKYEEEKQKKISALPLAVKNNYIKLVTKYSHNPIVYLHSDTCEGCNMGNPPQYAVNIKMKKKIEYCQNCGRILLIKEI